MPYFSPPRSLMLRRRHVCTSWVCPLFRTGGFHFLSVSVKQEAESFLKGVTVKLAFVRVSIRIDSGRRLRHRLSRRISYRSRKVNKLQEVVAQEGRRPESCDSTTIDGGWCALRRQGSCARKRLAGHSRSESRRQEDAKCRLHSGFGTTMIIKFCDTL